MSKVAIAGNASGTGTFTIAAPNSNTDRTLTLPDSAGTIATVEGLPAGYSDADALDLFNATGSAPVYACRAWVNFDGTGTVAIRASGNVSSITDNGTGDYTVNITTAMPDANYSVVATAQRNANGGTSVVGLYGGTAVVQTATTVRVMNINFTPVLEDPKVFCVSIFR